jgi:hypothetical protein
MVYPLYICLYYASHVHIYTHIFEKVSGKFIAKLEPQPNIPRAAVGSRAAELNL